MNNYEHNKKCAKEYGAPSIEWYKHCTTFMQDFVIADAFIKREPNAIDDTARRGWEFAKGDIVYATEMVVVLNKRLWMWHERGNQELAYKYHLLWQEYQAKLFETFENDDEAMRYYTTVVD